MGKRKVKTLVNEPDWKQLSTATTEIERLEAFDACEDYVHLEITPKEHLHSMKKWVRDHSGWNVGEKLRILPDTFLVAYAKQGWKFFKLGFMPESIEYSLTKRLKPLYERADKLKEKMHYERPIRYSLTQLDKEDELHPDTVKEWIKIWRSYLRKNKLYIDSSDAKLRQQYQTAQTYVSNMTTYLRTGIWLDNRYGENREGLMGDICMTQAYDENGHVKRTEGVFYPDLGIVWKNQTNE